MYRLYDISANSCTCALTLRQNAESEQIISFDNAHFMMNGLYVRFIEMSDLVKIVIYRESF